jgi:hypothetical protein|tara:strand:+ start:551 stop:733 length:183 start_codon:yes stop_codon:yes gene_type:complete
MYKQFKGGLDDSVITNMIMQIKDKDGNSITPKFIPFDEENTDYKEYLEWLAEGNTAEAAD